MKDEFKDYLESIGIKGELLSKIEEMHKFFTLYLERDIENIFISEYLDKEGSRVYENLWFFNSNFCFEAKLFNIQEDYDSTVIKDNIEYYLIKKVDFDIISNITNDNSRMNLEFRFKNSTMGGVMKASKENCRQLSIIFKKYIHNNQLI